MSFLKTETVQSLALPPAVQVGKDGDSRTVHMTMRWHTCSDRPILVLEIRQPLHHQFMEINITQKEAWKLAHCFAEIADYMYNDPKLRG